MNLAQKFHHGVKLLKGGYFRSEYHIPKSHVQVSNNEIEDGYNGYNGVGRIYQTTQFLGLSCTTAHALLHQKINIKYYITTYANYIFILFTLHAIISV